MFLINTGERIRQIRKRLRFTQQEVADKAGIAVNSIRNYESGKRKPNISQLQEIAHALEVDLFEILGAPPWSEAAQDAAKISDTISDVTKAGDLSLAMELTDEACELGLEIDIAEDRQIHERFMSALANLSHEGRLVALEQIEVLAKSPALQKKRPG